MIHPLKAQVCRALGLARSSAYWLCWESVEKRRLRKEIIELSGKTPPLWIPPDYSDAAA